MKRLVKLGLVMGLFIPCNLLAQKDSIHLFCPLDEAVVVPPPKNAIKFDPPDLCIVLASKPDTIVKAVVSGRVTTVEFTDESKNGVVLFSKINGKDYYFWYTGLEKVIVRRNEALKEGQAIGYIKPGGKIELLMYDFETPVDPTKYLGCNNVLKN